MVPRFPPPPPLVPASRVVPADGDASSARGGHAYWGTRLAPAIGESHRLGGGLACCLAAGAFCQALSATCTHADGRRAGGGGGDGRGQRRAGGLQGGYAGGDCGGAARQHCPGGGALAVAVVADGGVSGTAHVVGGGYGAASLLVGRDGRTRSGLGLGAARARWRARQSQWQRPSTTHSGPRPPRSYSRASRCPLHTQRAAGWAAVVAGDATAVAVV